MFSNNGNTSDECLVVSRQDNMEIIRGNVINLDLHGNYYDGQGLYTTKYFYITHIHDRFRESQCERFIRKSEGLRKSDLYT